ncbi:hypothetical protein D3C72_1543050 [compost metagenome]
MGDAGARAHHLHVAGLGAALVAQVVLVGDGPLADVGDDFHVLVRVRREAGLGGDLVVVPDAQLAPAHPLAVVVAGEGEMVTGIEPAVVGATQFGEGTYFDHVRVSCLLAGWFPREEWRA